MEKPKGRKGTTGSAPSKNSENEGALGASGLDKEGQTDASENVTSSEDRVLQLLGSIRQHLERDEASQSASVRVQNDQIRSLHEVVAGHAKVIELLLQSVPIVSTGKPAVGGNTGDEQGSKSVRGRKAAAITHKRVPLRSTTKVPPPPVSNHGLNNPTLKRKLEFSDDDGSDGMQDVQQNGPGSPFTYYTHFGHYMDGGEIPKCMELLFPPPEGMEFAGLDLVVAAYIFVKDLPASEVLVPDKHCPVTRGSLQTLCPGQQVIDDVLSLTAAMCSRSITAESSLKHWWLPTGFSVCSCKLILRMSFEQIAVSPGHHCPQTLEYIRKKFMGLADNLFKVYVPMHKDNHWYLMIVDFVSFELVYLDSLKVAKETKARKDQMRYVAFFLENMLADRSFYEDKVNSIFPKPSTFDVVEPVIGQQDAGSNDCGVWVAQWMIQSHLWRNYDLQVVNATTQMRLALDLVMGRHNALRTDIGRMAVDNWDARCRRSARKARRHGRPSSGKAAPTE